MDVHFEAAEQVDQTTVVIFLTLRNGTAGNAWEVSQDELLHAMFARLGLRRGTTGENSRTLKLDN